MYIILYFSLFLLCCSMEADDDSGAAGAGVRAGAAEHARLLEHDGLAAELLGPRQPDATRHLDHQPGSALGQRRAWT